MLIGLVLLAWMFHTWTYSEARATLEAKLLARSEATMHRLLSAMCDAVLHLGPDCIIRYPVPKLEVLLLKSRTQASLQGTTFTDLLDGTERDRFSHFLSSASNEPPRGELADQENVACVFHSHLKDASNRKVPIQIFHGSYLNLSEQICHIIGIREDQDTISHVQSLEPHTPVNGSLSPLMEHSTLPMREALSDSSSASASESAGEVTAWVDMSTPVYKVVKCTAGFSALCASSNEPMELLQWFSDRKREEFVEWAQESFNHIYNANETNTYGFKTEIKLMPPHLRRFKLNILATVELVDIEVEMPGNDDSDSSQPVVVMQLTFSNISWIQGNAASRR